MLNIFWKNHDSTRKCTSQYRSAIFYHDDEQKQLAEETMAEVQKKKNTKIRTEIIPMQKFWDAEGYHQKYLLQQHHWLLQAMDIDPGQELVDSHVAARVNGYIGGYGKLADFDFEFQKLGLNDKMADYVRNQHRKNYRGSS